MCFNGANTIGNLPRQQRKASSIYPQILHRLRVHKTEQDRYNSAMTYCKQLCRRMMDKDVYQEQRG